jgi:hypothetical protein
MTAILDLAPEAFTELISYLPTADWISLWLCGDRRLQWKLGKGKAVREMVLNCSDDSTFLWPSQINHLDGLHSFSFKSAFSFPADAFSALHLSTLSSNLMKLILETD